MAWILHACTPIACRVPAASRLQNDSSRTRRQHPTRPCPEPARPPCLQYAAELIATAKFIATPGKGILAADESTGTIGKRVGGRGGRPRLTASPRPTLHDPTHPPDPPRPALAFPPPCRPQLASIGCPNDEPHRRELREMLFTSPGIDNYISGVVRAPTCAWALGCATLLPPIRLLALCCTSNDRHCRPTHPTLVPRTAVPPQILYEETLFQNASDGTPFVKMLQSKNLIPGIKVRAPPACPTRPPAGPPPAKAERILPSAAAIDAHPTPACVRLSLAAGRHRRRVASRHRRRDGDPRH